MKAADSPIRRRRRWACVLAVLLGTASCTVSVGQSVLFPTRYERLPDMPQGIERRNIELTASDGVVLRGWYLEHPNARRTVLFFYGNRSSVVSSTWTLHWLSGALDANVVAFDYRGYGFSDGKAEIDRIVQDALEIHAYVVDDLGRGSTTIVSGAGDTLASPAAVGRLTAACGANRKFACRVPGGHGDVRAENPEVRKCIAGFVEDPAERVSARPASVRSGWGPVPADIPP